MESESKVQEAVRKALEHADQVSADVEVDLIRLEDYQLQFCDGRDPEMYEGDSRIVIDKIKEADALIIGSPIYRGAITGALKNLFDLLPEDALEAKVTGFIAIGEKSGHSYVIDHQLKPLAGYFKVHIVPSNVYVDDRHYSERELTDESIKKSLKRLGESIVELHEKIHGIGLVG